MIGLDSSVLLRYIIEDDPVWTSPAERFIDTQCTEDNPGYINPVVIAEIVWVLRRRLDFSRGRIAALIQEFLDSDSFKIGNEAAVVEALDLYRNTQAGFADCLIAALNGQAGASTTVAIDKDAVRDGVFVELPKEGTL